jgi:heme A synthase
MTIPRNVLRFEVLLYLSLLIDTLSAAFIARPSAEIDQAAAVSADTFVVIVFMFFLILVWLAARQRKNWARWALVVALALSVLSLLGSLSNGLTLAVAVDLFSTGLAGAGLYFAFSDDAEKWFH